MPHIITTLEFYAEGTDPQRVQPLATATWQAPISPDADGHWFVSIPRYDYTGCICGTHDAVEIEERIRRAVVCLDAAAISVQQASRTLRGEAGR